MDSITSGSTAGQTKNWIATSFGLTRSWGLSLPAHSYADEEASLRPQVGVIKCSVPSLIALTRPYNAWRYQREVSLEEICLVAVVASGVAILQ